MKTQSNRTHIEDWRRIKNEDSVSVDGKKWYQCPHQKHPNNPNDIYVNHPSEKHDQWELRKKNN